MKTSEIKIGMKIRFTKERAKRFDDGQNQHLKGTIYTVKTQNGSTFLYIDLGRGYNSSFNHWEDMELAPALESKYII